jgi:hypothetical protein
MDLRIEIVADQVIFRQDGIKAFAAPLKDFVSAVAERADSSFPLDMVPEGVRFVRWRGNAVVLVVEEKPQLRTVRWLADESSVPFGTGAVYRTARLAFPFIVSVLAFRDGGLTGFQQCFYRTAPLSRISDPLLLPNLFNVAAGHGQLCWLCLANLQVDLKPLPWNDKLREIHRHVWGAGFNRSSEIHEGMSYWSAMRNVDRRFDTIDTWAQASREDRYFPLKVCWKPSGKTVGDVIEQSIDSVSAPQLITVPHLGQLVSLLSHKAARRSSQSAIDAP